MLFSLASWSGSHMELGQKFPARGQVRWKLQCRYTTPGIWIQCLSIVRTILVGATAIHSTGTIFIVLTYLHWLSSTRPPSYTVALSSIRNLLLETCSDIDIGHSFWWWLQYRCWIRCWNVLEVLSRSWSAPYGSIETGPVSSASTPRSTTSRKSSTHSIVTRSLFEGTAAFSMVTGSGRNSQTTSQVSQQYHLFEDLCLTCLSLLGVIRVHGRLWQYPLFVGLNWTRSRAL